MRNEMKSKRGDSKSGLFLCKAAMLILLACIIGLAIQPAKAATNVSLWDTGTALTTTEPENKTGWKLVPSDLTAFEAEPLKADSDPGYYGREY